MCVGVGVGVGESKVTHARQKTSMLISTSLLDVYRLPDISNVQF